MTTSLGRATVPGRRWGEVWRAWPAAIPSVRPRRGRALAQPQQGSAAAGGTERGERLCLPAPRQRANISRNGRFAGRGYASPRPANGKVGGNPGYPPTVTIRNGMKPAYQLGSKAL